MLEPNKKYGYDQSITLCLRGVTEIAGFHTDKPFDIDLKGVKFTTDDKSSLTIESWEDAIFLIDDGSIDWEYTKPIPIDKAKESTDFYQDESK